MPAQRDSHGRFIAGSGSSHGGVSAEVVITAENSAAIERLLKSEPGLRSLLQAKADAIAASAGPGHEGSVWVGADRMRGQVKTTTVAAAKAEAEDHSLLKALDSARSS